MLTLVQASSGPPAESAFRQVYEEGQQALSENRLEDAEKAFRKVLAMHPQDAGAYVNLGVIAMRRKQWVSRFETWDKASDWPREFRVCA
jgi:Flp pilus assembly protein TadD